MAEDLNHYSLSQILDYPFPSPSSQSSIFNITTVPACTAYHPNRALIVSTDQTISFEQLRENSTLILPARLSTLFHRLLAAEPPDSRHP